MIYKSDIIDSALMQGALSGSLFDPDPFTLNSAGILLEALMLELSARNLYIGWIAAEDVTNPDTADDSGIPDWALRGAGSMLAIELLNSLGMPVPAYLHSVSERFIGTIGMNTELIQPSNLNMPLGSAYDVRQFSDETTPQLLTSDNSQYVDVPYEGV